MPISEWRNYKNLYQLQGSKCSECEKLFYPKRRLCICGCRDFKDYKFSGSGKLISFTQINNFVQKIQAPVPKYKTTYCIGIVHLKEGPKILAQITDVKLEDLFIGASVQAVFRKMNNNGEDCIISYGIKFVIIKGKPVRDWLRND